MRVRSLWFILIVALLMIMGSNGDNPLAQVQTTGKPAKRPKPEETIECTQDGICELSEYDPDKSPEEQPCPDCQPAPSPVLLINQNSAQLITNGGSGYTAGKILQYKHQNGGFKNTWISQSYNAGAVYSSIGDVDNDNEKEIIGLAVYYISIPNPGKGKKTIPGRNHNFIIYEDLCADGEPSWEGPMLGETSMMLLGIGVADADNDTLYDDDGNILVPDNEIVVRSRYQIHIYEWNGQDFLWSSSSPVHDQFIFSASVGDADNDGLNEIIVSQFDTGLVYIYDYEDGNWDAKITPPISDTNPFGSPVKIDYARVGDADNDGKNEIVAGGNNYRLMIWKYDEVHQAYEIEFVSDLLGGFTQGVDVGDLDNDGVNEVVVGAAQSQMMFVFQHDGRNYNVVNSQVFPEGVNDLIIGDLDNDGFDEVIITYEGIRIFVMNGSDIISGFLEQSYYHPYGGDDIEIK